MKKYILICLLIIAGLCGLKSAGLLSIGWGWVFLPAIIFGFMAIIALVILGAQIFLIFKEINEIEKRDENN